VREAKRILSELGRTEALPSALNLEGLMLCDMGRHEEARATLREGLVHAQANGTERSRGFVYGALGLIALDGDDPVEARRLGEIGLAAFESRHDLRGIGWCHNLLGLCSVARGETEDALQRLERAVDTFRQMQNGELLAPLCDLAVVLCRRGMPERARACLREAFERGGSVFWFERVFALEVSASVLVALGDGSVAARLLGAAQAWREQVGVPKAPRIARFVDETTGRVRAEVGAASFRRWLAKGRRLDEKAARALALEHLAGPVDT
jgi:tetratricopeptide (TPR) repeat protein